MGWVGRLVGWLVGKLITLICANFHHLRNLLSITSPSKWQLNYHWETASFQRNKIIMLTTAISDFTLYLLLLLSMANSNFITYHFLSLLSPSLSFSFFSLMSLTNDILIHSLPHFCELGVSLLMHLGRRASPPERRLAVDHMPGSLPHYYSCYLHKLLHLCLNMKCISRMWLETASIP